MLNFFAEETYQFIDFEDKPVWIGGPKISKSNVTLDGVNYFTETRN